MDKRSFLLDIYDYLQPMYKAINEAGAIVFGALCSKTFRNSRRYGGLSDYLWKKRYVG